MRILFLDDNEARHQVFRSNSVGHTVDHAYTAAEAIAYLGMREYGLVFLDHDLGGPESEGKLIDGERDGRFVARTIAYTFRRHEHTTFIIHSLNTAGARKMGSLIEDTGLNVWIIPFAWKVQVKDLLEIVGDKNPNVSMGARDPA